MALRNVLTFGDEALRKKSREIMVFDDKLWVLLDDLNETMKHHNGVGLAAPQVGILRRVAVVNTGDGLIELVNPVITQMKGKQRRIEGCLSSPGEWGYVKRPLKVRVRAQNRYGKEVVYEGTELKATAFCHEIDHLNGVIFTDLADEMVENGRDDEE